MTHHLIRQEFELDLANFGYDHTTLRWNVSKKMYDENSQQGAWIGWQAAKASALAVRWLPISEAPKNSECVFLFCSNSFDNTNGVFIGYFDRAKELLYGWREQDSGIEYNPTKWAPLPTPPRDNDGDE